MVGIAIPAGGTCANEVAVLETNGRLRIHDRVDRAGGWAFAALRSIGDMLPSGASIMRAIVSRKIKRP